MSETLRDLVVSLSLNSDNFSRNIKSINKQIHEAESAFRLASAGVENFETTTAGLSFKLSTADSIRKLREREMEDRIPPLLTDLAWDCGAANMYAVVRGYLGEEKTAKIVPALRALASDGRVTVPIMQQWIGSQVPKEQIPMVWYFAMLASRTE